MAVIYPFEGKERVLESYLGGFANWTLRLFQNDVTPDNDTVFADLDEADFSGYGSVNLTLGGVVENGDGNAQSTALIVEFVHDGGGTANDVYGWYLTTSLAAVDAVMYAERFADAPRVMEFVDDQIDITPQLIQGDCPP